MNIVKSSNNELVGAEGYKIPKNIEMLTLGTKLSDSSLKYNGIPGSMEYEDDHCYIQVYKDEMSINNENKEVMLVFVNYPGVEFEDGIHTMACELCFCGSDLVYLNGVVHDLDERKINSGMMPVYSISLSDGTLSLKHYNGEQVKKLKTLIGSDVFKFWLEESIKSVDDNSLLPDDKNKAVIDVSSYSVEDIFKLLMRYLRDNNYANINEDIANNTKTKGVSLS